MKIRNAIIYGLLASACAIPAVSEARVYADITVAPPPPRHEIIPGPRHGYVWAPGYWDWRGRHYVWVPGRYVPARVGARWAPHRWYERNGHWVMDRGHWER
jgi:hypothetical protein